ncbi:DUF58 domain-containing protein [Halobacterium wangiae]|uniref:DUF58 domain-containing protein n=1 Tax=Halobacterium wangiae TaxID=2902623 RepID=UPI001E3E1B2C|nr:DUF58 domain-containing protein [Halobacterium wangiae]
MTTQSRFAGALLATLTLAAAGALSGQRTLFVAAAIPLAFVVYGAISTPASVENLRVTRTLSKESPLPGDRVRVTLTVENVGDSVLPDVRVADGVPDGLRVVEGQSEGAFAVPAGETATVEYTVVADRGQFPFDPPTVRLRGMGAAATRTAHVEATGVETLDCRVTVADIPLRRQTTAHAGTLPTDSGGPGIEFHSTRDYQHGDPVSRINWRRYAKTGELSTVNYRERRAAAVVLAVDARESSDVSAHSGTPSGAALSAYAAAQAVEPLESGGHQVGLAVFGLDDPLTGATDPAWVPPGSGDAHHARLSSVLDAALDGEGPIDDEDTPATAGSDGEAEPAPTTEPATADGGRPWAGAADGEDARVKRFAGRVSPRTQVVVYSPSLDEFPAMLARRLVADDHRVTAVCPDVTTTDTPGRTLAAADRTLAMDALRATGAQVVDWSPDESLSSAVSRAAAAVERGSR